jgi:predicted metal-binding membrane protein
VIHDDRDGARVRNGLLALTALAWILALRNPGIHARHHPVAREFSATAAGDWLLMLTAMMAPVLIQPLQFVRSSSLARRRARSTLLFVAGYMAVWMLTGALMIPLAGAERSSGLPPLVRVAAVFVIAFVWQCSPTKQVCLNRCHAFHTLAAFGRAADIDALVFGAAQGVWCAGSCWAWMLLPLLLPTGHTMAMAVTAVLIFCERIDGPAPVGWRWRGFGRARRIVAARMNLLLSPRPQEGNATRFAG